jgi:hypothetical protein
LQIYTRPIKTRAEAGAILREVAVLTRETGNLAVLPRLALSVPALGTRVGRRCIRRRVRSIAGTVERHVRNIYDIGRNIADIRRIADLGRIADIRGSADIACCSDIRGIADLACVADIARQVRAAAAVLSRHVTARVGASRRAACGEPAARRHDQGTPNHSANDGNTRPTARF